MRILVVDDEEITLDLLEATLEADGHKVLRACNGLEALQVLERNTIELVISDWMMPALSGVDLISRIRAMHTNRYIYLIMLTSRSDKGDIVEGLNAGADDFIVKPVRSCGADRSRAIRRTCAVAGKPTGDNLRSREAHRHSRRRNWPSPRTNARIFPNPRRAYHAYTNYAKKALARLCGYDIPYQPAARYRQSRHSRLRVAETRQAG